MSDPNTQKALYSSQGVVAKTEAIFAHDAGNQSSLLNLGYIDLQSTPSPRTSNPWYTDYLQWFVPAGVTSISIVGCGCGFRYGRSSSRAGGGAAFVYKNNISVAGGNELYIFTGHYKGSSDTSATGNGGGNNYGYEQSSSQSHWGLTTNSWVYNATSGKTLWVAEGGAPDQTASNAAQWTRNAGHYGGNDSNADGGGNGGGGGPNRTGGPWFNAAQQGGTGGAGGYTGTGGTGGHYGTGSSSPHNAFGPYVSWGNGTAGTGSSAGGASGKNYTGGGNGFGGATYVWGAGDPGAGTTAGGQSGGDGSYTGTGAPNNPTWGKGGNGGQTVGQNYWGGGASAGKGIIRIVWPGTTRQFPSTNVGWPL
tara:strand:- start:3724 stop:4815 length:1092 start_codon:yes stop_codon:yes gene_type:complete